MCTGLILNEFRLAVTALSNGKYEIRRFDGIEL